jgi:hypothetical protein
MCFKKNQIKGGVIGERSSPKIEIFFCILRKSINKIINN